MVDVFEPVWPMVSDMLRMQCDMLGCRLDILAA